MSLPINSARPSTWQNKSATRCPMNDKTNPLYLPMTCKPCAVCVPLKDICWYMENPTKRQNVIKNKGQSRLQADATLCFVGQAHAPAFTCGCSAPRYKTELWFHIRSKRSAQESSSTGVWCLFGTSLFICSSTWGLCLLWILCMTLRESDSENRMEPNLKHEWPCVKGKW